MTTPAGTSTSAFDRVVCGVDRSEAGVAADRREQPVKLLTLGLSA